MTNKQIYWGLGLLAVTVVGVIIYKKNKKPVVVAKKEEEKSGFLIPSTGAKRCLRAGGTVSLTPGGQYNCGNCPNCISVASSQNAII